jgi:hypothetical protein
MFRGAMVLVAGVTLFGCRKAAPKPEEAAPPASAMPLPTPPQTPSRCDEPAPGATLLLGEERSGDEADTLPFSVEVGQGVATGDGFAVGALMPDPKRGSRAVVVMMGEKGGSRTVPLHSAHGDTPPPRLAYAAGQLWAGLLESGASNRHLKLARVDQPELHWGAEFEQGRDESLAFDLAIGAQKGIVVWDDDGKDPDRGVIRLATFPIKAGGNPSSPRTLSEKNTDAEMPRVVPRAGGFWLTWIARRPERTDDDAREVGESPEFRWIEALPLDDNGAPTGQPRRVTPEKGHVLTYDLLGVEGGNAIIVYRDDDTPSGSSGGVLMRVSIRPDGASEPVVIADRHLGIGSPTLLPGWIAMADATEETRLGRLDPRGELIDRFESERVLDRGEPVAARGDALLVIKPRGQSVRLLVTRCHPQAPTPASPADSAP